jgi:hypothetical protein
MWTSAHRADLRNSTLVLRSEALAFVREQALFGHLFVCQLVKWLYLLGITIGPTPNRPRVAPRAR